MVILVTFFPCFLKIETRIGHFLFFLTGIFGNERRGRCMQFKTHSKATTTMRRTARYKERDALRVPRNMQSSR